MLSCFLTVSGAQTYDTGRSSLLRGSPETSAFDEMTELLKQHFSLSHASLFRDPISWMKSSAWWGSAGQFPELSIRSQPWDGRHVLDDLPQHCFLCNPPAPPLVWTKFVFFHGLKQGFFFLSIWENAFWTHKMKPIGIQRKQIILKYSYFNIVSTVIKIFLKSNVWYNTRLLLY